MSDDIPLYDAAALIAAGRAVPVPFRLALDGGRELVVQRVLRVLPGKRVVGEALWDGRPVLAKLFIGRSAARRWRQEDDGIAALAEQGLPTPERLLSQAFADGGYLLLTRFVPASATLADAWRALPKCSPPGAAEALAVLRPAFAQVGRLHARGLAQDDLHLGNFLRAGDQLFVIDGDSVRAVSPGLPLDPTTATRNLAILFAQLAAEWDALLDDLLAAYARGNPGALISVPALMREVRRLRSRRLHDYLAKTTRDCTLFAVDRRVQRFSAMARAEADWLSDVVADPDRFLAGGQLLKDGATCTVARAQVAGRSVVIKRYNLKGIGHALGRALRPSRAWHSWREGHRLRFLGIATPPPLALVEERAGPFRRRAWLVSEFCDGPRLGDLLHPDAEPPPAVADALLRFVAALQRARISHGDFKMSNLLWHDGQIVVIDLDAMVQHRSARAYAKAWRRDRARLLRNWPVGSALVCWLDAHLPIT